jgi:histidyl-tRNA synthetase
LGDKGVGKQLKNADAQDIPVVLLYGSNEKERDVVTVKRMSVGKSKAQEFDDRNEWLSQRAGQFESNRSELVADLKKLLEATGN